MHKDQFKDMNEVFCNLSNQLSHEFPNKIIVAVYLSKDIANISLRDKQGDIRKITLKAIEGLPGAVGGGHEHACGARVNISDLPEFKKRIEMLVIESK